MAAEFVLANGEHAFCPTYGGSSKPPKGSCPNAWIQCTGRQCKGLLSLIGGTASRRAHFSTQDDTISPEHTRSPGTGLVAVTMGYFKQVGISVT